jgi:nicotinate phosphoribosyltransferase
MTLNDRPGEYALFADAYAFTAPYAFFKTARHETRASFYMFHRKSPFGSGYAIAAGLEYAVKWLQSYTLDDEDIRFLAEMPGNDGKPLFTSDYLDYLRGFRFKCDLDAAPEGSVVFPHEPMVRMEGTITECLLAETLILNVVNSQSLFATKASRMCEVARGEPVLEFGARRAQGVDGALSAARACYIGGVAGTSLVQAGKMFKIPVKGTHPHAFVMYFDSELEAFEAYARAMPNNAVFLVDTYDTLEGVKNAILACKVVHAAGKVPIGIRLDSGDLAYLSIEARKLLDEAGLPDMKIFASNDLDERLIESLKSQGAQIAVWGVGTKLSTSYDQPAFGGVWKMSAMQRPSGDWASRIKLSEQSVKTSIPGRLRVRRYLDANGGYAADMIYDVETFFEGVDYEIVDPVDPLRRKTIAKGTPFNFLLHPILRGGVLEKPLPQLDAIRRNREEQMARLHTGVLRLDNPHSYPVGIERSLHERRTQMALDGKKHGK